MINKLNEGMALSDILLILNENDFTFFVTLSALIAILKDKKDSNGNPLITEEELNFKMIEIKEKLLAKQKIITPNSGIVINTKKGEENA